VDVIAAQKNASLDRVTWKYDEDEARERMLKVRHREGEGQGGKSGNDRWG
jgi:hypothetical protein